jgi:molecular chaperone GrpE
VTLQELAQRFAEVERERDAHLDDLKRLAAEFDNYRKRVARDQEALVARANERIVRELLPVLDDLERALEAAAEHEEAAQRPVRASGPGEGVRGNREVPLVPGDVAGAHEVFEGVRLVHRNLAELLRREGLGEIETNGRFDPHVHEALLAQPSDSEEGSVIDVVQKGYTLGDRVIRPARVVVASAETTQAPVRDSGPVEGVRGNREVPPANREVQSGGDGG